MTILRHAIQATAPATTKASLINSSAVFTVTVTNIGDVPDTYSILLQGYNWPTSSVAATGLLAPGGNQTITVTVQIPPLPLATWSDSVQVILTSNGNTFKTASISLTTKAFLPPTRYAA